MDCHSTEIADDGSDIEEDWEEIVEPNEEVDCLFCTSIFGSVIEALSHCIESHKLDFIHLKTKFKMDCYSFFKLVNFVRKRSTAPEDLIAAESPIWNDETFLKPVKECDPWLIFDLEDYYEEKQLKTSLNFHNGNSVEQNLVSELQAQLAQKDEELCELKNQITLMRNCIHKILQDDSFNENRNNHVPAVDSSYFDSYCNPGIHHDMLSDSVRTQSYQNAIQKNESVFSEKIVLDLGCGTGILSMFAASSSQKVYAVDNSDIAYYATEIIRENNLDSKICIKKGLIEDERIELEKVDIILSEWMGYFLLFEGMLDSVLYARDRYLKPNGVMLPDSCNLFLCGAEDPDGVQNKITFWSDVHGYRMSSIKREVIKEAIIDVMSAEKIVTSEACISSFNLYTCSVADTNFTSSIELICLKDTTITTFVGYFDTIFNLPSRVQFSTSPLCEPTHWKQTLFYLPAPIARKQGEKLIVNLTCERCSTDKRSLIITIVVNSQQYVYNIR